MVLIQGLRVRTLTRASVFTGILPDCEAPYSEEQSNSCSGGEGRRRRFSWVSSPFKKKKKHDREIIRNVTPRDTVTNS
jgi:hypothetical protein